MVESQIFMSNVFMVRKTSPYYYYQKLLMKVLSKMDYTIKIETLKLTPTCATTGKIHVN
jgi:hypothetical protein